MGAGPIEEAAVKAVDGTGPQLAVSMKGSPPQPGSEYFGTEQVSAEKSKGVELYSPQEELIKAQHLFIEAQTEYIHNPDVAAIAAAQEAYIAAQTRFIARTMGKN